MARPGADPAAGKRRHSAAEVKAHGLRRFRVAAIGYATLFGLSHVLVVFGLLPRRETWIVTGYCGAGLIAFYFLIDSRRAQRFADPSCAFAQVLFGISTLLLGCALIPQNRLAAVQMFFLIVAYDFTRLSHAQMRLVFASTVAGMLVLSACIYGTTTNHSSMSRELLALVMAVVYVPLLIAVSRVVRRMMSQQSRQRAALAEALEQLQVLSERDPLTGASNRRHGEALLEREAARHSRYRMPLSLGLLDIDFFKRINDGHGHATGDAVLVELVRLTEAALAPGFSLARWGGEEFLIVMPDTPAADAAAAMRRVRDAIHQADWTACAPGLRVDVSIGVCEHEAGGAVHGTLEQADAALYQAKREGRGRVVEHLG